MNQPMQPIKLESVSLMLTKKYGGNLSNNYLQIWITVTFTVWIFQLHVKTALGLGLFDVRCAYYYFVQDFPKTMCHHNRIVTKNFNIFELYTILSTVKIPNYSKIHNYHFFTTFISLKLL